jgi:hypothetical protein
LRCIDHRHPCQHQLQDVGIRWKQRRPDQILLALVARGHLDGRADLLEPLFGFFFSQRPAQRSLFVFELRFEVRTQLGNDVVLPFPGQVLFTA